MFVYAIAGLIGTVHETIRAYLPKACSSTATDRSSPPSTTCTVSALAIVIALHRIDREWKVVLGSRSWNYANEPLNIGGRTTVPFMLFWGLLCYLIVRFILPFVLWLVHLIDDTWHTRSRPYCWRGFSSTPWSRRPRSSCTAARQRRGVRQLVRAAYQAAFDDDFMRLHFPNMRV